MVFKNTVLTCLAALLLFFSINPVASAENQPRLGPNLVRNSGFEQGVESWTTQRATVVSTQFYEGKNSLEYQNASPDAYRVQTQDISAKPGQTIHFSAWIKGQDVIHRDRRYGASVFVQSYDKAGKYLGGSFPSGITGSFDWRQIKGLYIVPAEAEKIMIGVYLRRGAIGTAWFDSVSAQVEQQPSFKAFLEYPNYRGITTPVNQNPWRVVVLKSASEGNSPVQVESSLRSSSGEVLFNKTESFSSDEKMKSFSWEPHNNLPAGTYQWHFETTANNERTSDKQVLSITVRPTMPQVFIDSSGFTVLNGQRYFPLGIFSGNSSDQKESYNTDADLEKIASAGFNTVLSYSYGNNENSSAFLDNAQQKGLHVIYSLKDMYGDQINSQVPNYLQRLKTHPALLAWYINDEFGPDRIPEIQKMYQKVLDLDDTQRPAYQVLYQVGLLEGYLSSLDVVGSDPYPISKKDINEVSDWTNQTTSAANSIAAKGVWQVLQLHDLSFVRNAKTTDRPPTLDEMRNMSYQAVINGSKGLMFYAYHWLWATDEKRQRDEDAFQKRWPDIERLIQEIKPLTEVILKDQKVALQILSPSTAQYQAWQDNDTMYLMVVNAGTNDKPESLQLQIPDGWRLTETKVPGIQAQLKGRSLHLELSPIASGTLTFQRR